MESSRPKNTNETQLGVWRKDSNHVKEPPDLHNHTTPNRTKTTTTTTTKERYKQNTCKTTTNINLTKMSRTKIVVVEVCYETSETEK